MCACNFRAFLKQSWEECWLRQWGASGLGALGDAYGRSICRGGFWQGLTCSKLALDLLKVREARAGFLK